MYVSKFTTTPRTFTSNPSPTIVQSPESKVQSRDQDDLGLWTLDSGLVRTLDFGLAISSAGSITNGSSGIRYRGPQEPSPGQNAYSPKKTITKPRSAATNTASARCPRAKRQNPHT